MRILLYLSQQRSSEFDRLEGFSFGENSFFLPPESDQLIETFFMSV